MIVRFFADYNSLGSTVALFVLHKTGPLWMRYEREPFFIANCTRMNKLVRCPPLLVVQMRVVDNESRTRGLPTRRHVQMVMLKRYGKDYTSIPCNGPDEMKCLP